MSISSLICVIYDGINQAIFEGQVVLPLIKRAQQGKYQSTILVSFETTINDETQKLVKQYQLTYPTLHFALYRRTRFINTFFLWHQAHQLKHFLKNFSAYDLIARGPFAGLIAKKAVTKNCSRFIIQARGLVAQEYGYAHKHEKGLRSLAHTARLQQLHMVEKHTYTRLKKKNLTFLVEVISPALQEYLVATYQTPANLCVIAPFDTPTPVDPTKKSEYRTSTRTHLGISEQAAVYVYNGSLQPWQCPQETIASFKKQWLKDKTCIFLALTTDTTTMEQLLITAEIPAMSYRIMTVPHHKVLEFLCAANYGFLIREQHLMNWVSRPTKLLEYQAAGLQVIHNNTIKLLQDTPIADEDDL